MDFLADGPIFMELHFHVPVLETDPHPPQVSQIAKVGRDPANDFRIRKNLRRLYAPAMKIDHVAAKKFGKAFRMVFRQAQILASFGLRHGENQESGKGHKREVQPKEEAHLKIPGPGIGHDSKQTQADQRGRFLEKP